MLIIFSPVAKGFKGSSVSGRLIILNQLQQIKNISVSKSPK